MSKNIKRYLGKSILEASKDSKVVLLTGPRQVGKTTLLKDIQKNNRSYISLDNLTTRIAAQEDPESFLERLNFPVFIDEVQYAPDLFPYIKIYVDNSDKKGQIWLTGSQQFNMMKNISESLAGRVAILKLQGISLAEEQNRKESEPFLPTVDLLKSRQKNAKIMTVSDIYKKIWRGSFPDMVSKSNSNWERFYESYVTTYIQRDIKESLNINDHVKFYKFMQVIAARTGQLINFSDISRDVGISEPTVKSWINALEASGVIFLLQPYFNNITKRIIKTPKLYFIDTGLCAFLTGWLNSDVLERGAISGAIFETYVVSEIIKSYLHNGRTPRIFFYRDKEQREIDILIEENGVLYPVEVKKTSMVKNINVKFDILKTLKMPIGHGGVICLTKNILPISKDIDALPVSYI